MPRSSARCAISSHVTIGVGVGESHGPESSVGVEEHRGLGGVHPREQVGVVGEVGDTVVGDPAHRLVHGEDALDRRVGLGPGPVGREPDEVRRLEETAERVLAVARVLRDAGHGVGVQHLDEERPEPADEHGRQVAVDDARHAVEGEVGLGRIVATRGRFLRESDRLADVAVDASS